MSNTYLLVTLSTHMDFFFLFLTIDEMHVEINFGGDLNIVDFIVRDLFLSRSQPVFNTLHR